MNIPQLSIQERNRRYQIVRAEMPSAASIFSARQTGRGNSYKATRAI
jgi:hypothetical protein